MKYKVLLKEFLNDVEISDMFREIAKKENGIVLVDFSNVKTINKISFKTLLDLKKSLELLGKKVEFCCIPPYIAQIIAMWDIDVETIYNEV